MNSVALEAHADLHREQLFWLGTTPTTQHPVSAKWPGWLVQCLSRWNTGIVERLLLDYHPGRTCAFADAANATCVLPVLVPGHMFYITNQEPTEDGAQCIVKVANGGLGSQVPASDGELLHDYHGTCIIRASQALATCLARWPLHRTH